MTRMTLRTRFTQWRHRVFGERGQVPFYTTAALQHLVNAGPLDMTTFDARRWLEWCDPQAGHTLKRTLRNEKERIVLLQQIYPQLPDGLRTETRAHVLSYWWFNPLNEGVAYDYWEPKEAVAWKPVALEMARDDHNMMAAYLLRVPGPTDLGLWRREHLQSSKEADAFANAGLLWGILARDSIDITSFDTTSFTHHVHGAWASLHTDHTFWFVIHLCLPEEQLPTLTAIKALFTVADLIPDRVMQDALAGSHSTHAWCSFREQLQTMLAYPLPTGAAAELPLGDFTVNVD